MDDTMLSPFFKLPTLRTDQLITLPFLFCGLWLFVCLVFAFGLFVFSCWHRDSLLDYVLVLLQFNF